MSPSDVLMHNPVKEIKAFFASSENEQEFRQTDHHGFFWHYFSEHNRVMSLNPVQSGVRRQKSEISPA